MVSKNKTSASDAFPNRRDLVKGLALLEVAGSQRIFGDSTTADARGLWQPPNSALLTECI